MERSCINTESIVLVTVRYVLTNFPRSMYAFKWLLLVVLLAMNGNFTTSLFAEQTLPSYQGYTPLKEDGYVQVWYLTFSGERHQIQMAFIVSNIGPGNSNNGSAVMIHSMGEDQSCTDERTEKSLKAVPGSFGMRTAASEVKNVNGYIEAYVECSMGKFYMKIEPDLEGPLLPEWRLRGEDYFRIGEPVLRGNATAILVRNEVGVTLKGRGAMDSILTNVLPNDYAKRLIYIHGNNRFSTSVIGYLDLKNQYHLKLYRHEKKGLREEHIVNVTQENVERDGFSFFHLPRRLIIHTDECDYRYMVGDFKGGMYLLASVTPLLRWVLKIFFAQPFLLNYQARLEIECQERASSSEDSSILYLLLNQ